MKRNLSIILLILLVSIPVFAQNDFEQDGFDAESSTFNPNKRSSDSTKTKKAIPTGMYVWTVDQRFGDRTIVPRDTVQHLFMNSGFTTGVYGDYNSTGNLGAPRINRIFADRKSTDEFLFTQPYDYSLTPASELRFTNTLSPITNLSYYSCGDRTDGEDYLRALFAVNAGKDFGAGMKFNYTYGRGYYQNQANSMFNWTLWASYLGERYQAHFIFDVNHLKNTESGGITNDNYITHPQLFNESFSSSEIPTVLSSNWNRFHTYNIFFTHRYSVGFFRKVPMTEEEKEAKRFALKAQKEKESREQRDKDGMQGRTDDRRKESNAPLAGRPSDAKIMGDLKVDSLGQKIVERVQVDNQAVADSLAALSKEEKTDTSWLKNEYVPVTSFIHTLKFNHSNRRYIAYTSPTDYYAFNNNTVGVAGNDSINDITRYYDLKNTFAIAMLEGFNKWVKSGFKVFLTHDLRHYELPDTVSRSKIYNESNISVGAQLVKTQGSYFHYNVTGEFGVVGEDAGNIRVDADADVNIPLFGDTVRLDLNGYFHHDSAPFLLRHYHSRHFWWDNDLDKQIHTHVEGHIDYPKTKSSVRVAVDNLNNYAYLATSYERSSSNLPVNYQANVRQTSKNISVLSVQYCQNFRLGILNWENRLTYQKSTQQDIIPVPALNVWSNLYIDFRIARVLKCHFGADVVYFTKYAAPEYCGQLSQYAVQENADVRTEIGNYPFVDVYANFVLKGCRFFVMMSHVNASQGNYFTTAHYPMNERVFRFGLSWNFNN